MTKVEQLLIATPYSNDPRDIGTTVVGGLTGNGNMTQAELDQKIEATKESFRAKTSIESLKEIMRENRKHNAGSFKVDQIPHKSNAPFVFYLQHVLKSGDKPPRGKVFKNCAAGMPYFIFADEF